MGKPKAKNSKRKKTSDSASDTSVGTPKRTCSESRIEQKRITEYATFSMADSLASREKIDQILAQTAELKSVPKLILDLKSSIEQLRGEVLDLTQKCKTLEHNLETEKGKNVKLEQQLKEAKCQAQLALTKANDIEQWNRRSSVRIAAGIPHRLPRQSIYLAHVLNIPSFSKEHIDNFAIA